MVFTSPGRQFFPRMLLGLMLAFLAAPAALLAQGGEPQSGIIRGHLVNASTGTPANDVNLSIPSLRRLTTSDGNGDFAFYEVPYGTYTVIIGGTLAEADSQRITINSPVSDAGTISVRFAEQSAVAQQAEMIPTIALEDNNGGSSDDDGFSGQAVSGLLTASRDPFLNTTAFVFGQYRFQPRGYDRNSQQVLINGAPMNDVETGDAYWSQWGGLNDVFRGRSLTYGLQPSEYAFGGIGGTTYFDATAENQRKQTRVTYSLSNRSYQHRAMITHSTGMMRNGWAFSVSASRRWSGEGYQPGTFYDGYSYYFGASKRIGNKHLINFTTFGAPTRRGKFSPVIQEGYDIAGSNYYNPNWGFQNGEKRNSRVSDAFQPVGILNYEFTPTDRTRWNTALAYQTGKNKNSTLDWYNGDNPRPDYYRNFPSWWTSEGKDPAMSEFAGNQQIDWDRLIQRNRDNFDVARDVNGITGNDVSGRRSIYVVSNDVDDVQKWVFNTNIQHVVTDHITYTGGLSYINQFTRSYRELDDLLGGDFYQNLNQFADQQYTAPGTNQYDLNAPSRIVKEGDKYYYDYKMHFTRAWMFQQLAFTYNKVDFFVAFNGGFNDFQRDGLYRNGLFSEGHESFGKSSIQRFALYGLKGGATYKINGRHYLFVNGGVQSDAPTVDNTFISPRIRNTVIPDPQEQITYTAEGGYLLKAPNVNARVVGYVTDIRDATEVKRFYNESSAASSFVNYALRNVNQRFTGLELALDYKVHPQLNITAVAALGQAFYTNNPEVSSYGDLDSTEVPQTKTVYLKNHYLAVGPQTAATLGFNYRSKKYWYASLNLNYFDRSYVDVSPDRRSAEAVSILEPGSPQYRAIMDQERLPSAFMIDIFAGKSIMLSKIFKSLPRNTFIYLNAGVSNLLDNQKFRTGGFEQLRFDYQTSNPSQFPSKYFYALGRNYFLNVAFKF